MSLNEIQNAPSVAEAIEQTDQIEENVPEFDDVEPTQDLGGSSYEPHAVIRDKAERKKVRRRLFGVGMIWLTTLAILALAALLAWLFRAQIVEKFPATRSVYSALGIEASQTGLLIQNIRSEYGDVDGIPVLFINGEIKNYDQQTRDVPLVQINFKNSNGEILTNWVIEPPKSQLLKGELQKFSGQYPNPPIDATSFVPLFVNERTIESGIPEPQ